jgi:hypothetical protein
LRPSGWTSADAAGLPILPGLVRYDEVAAGVIDHAIRVTLPATDARFIWPARHQAGTANPSLAPMGQRLRLKASVNIAGYSAANQVILRALEHYGAIVADNGSPWFLSGAPDSRWNNDDLHLLGQIKGSDFEAVDESSLMVDPNSGATTTAAATTTKLSSAPNPSTQGQQVTFTATVSPTSSNGTMPTGTVRFDDGSTALGTAALSSGIARWSTVGLTAGTHSITAAYSGDSVFAATSATSLSQSVVGAPSITMVTPNGGQRWARGVSHTIKWSYSGATGTSVRIDLLTGGIVTSTIAPSAPLGSNGSGAYAWTPPSQLTPGSTYRVRVTVVGSSPVVAATSHANFRLT